VAFPFFLTKLLVRTGLARYLPAVQRRTDGGAAFVHYYGDRVLAAPHADLRAVAELLEPYPADVIDLSAGAPRFDLAPSGSTKLPADRRGWPPPWGLPELRTAVAEKLRTERCLACSPADEVLITHGAAGAFSIALDAFINTGARVVLFDPTSPLYALALRPRRARIRWVPTSMEEGRIRFRLDHLDQALRGARLLVLALPANPTGGVFAAEDLEQIAWWAERHDVLIFSDEVFDRFRYDGAAPSMGTLPRAQRRTVTAGSVSKGYALASARVGWLAGCRHLVRPCAVAAAQQTPFVPTLCQQLALAALRQGDEAFAPIRAEFESRRRYGFERLRALGLPAPWPSGAFFFWVPVGQLGISGQVFAERLLRGKKVAVTPGKWFGPSGTGYVRLSYAVEDGRLREGLGRLGEFVREMQTPKEAAKQAA
jgi:aspartate/methionine/tyrosine aminotransferase